MTVTSMQKHRENCQCDVVACIVYGIPRKTLKYHVLGCICTSCKGREKGKRGRDSQVNIAKNLGYKVSNLHPGEESLWRAAFRCEMKSELPVGPRKRKGAIQCIFEWHARVAEQSDGTKALGDNRPFLAGASLVGEPYDLIIMRSDKVTEVLDALAEQRSR